MWPFRKPAPLAALTGVGALLTARHIPPHRLGEPHEHIWEVTIWYEDKGFDALPSQHALVQLLKPYQDQILPADMARGETLARYVWRHVFDYSHPTYVTVSRAEHRLYARFPK